MPASRSTFAFTSARPALRPSSSPCSKASLCASACRSARPPTVAIFCCGAGLSMSGTVHNATVAPGFKLASEKLSRPFAAETDGALFGHALRNHDDFLLRRFDVRQLYRTPCLHVVFEDFRRPLRHVLQYLLLHLGLGAAQGHRQGIRTHLAQQRLDAA